MNSTEQVRVGSVTYTTFVNYDYGSARGVDLIFEKRRGQFFTGNIQYAYSVAKGNRFRSLGGVPELREPTHHAEKRSACITTAPVTLARR
ncbi:MAG: hypothetical protein U5N26_01875 [Candidatus Marinimicrobia bacterium]|nr:hypothetical protein [Candidatus Neomarinimicrobiota bacterium]